LIKNSNLIGISGSTGSIGSAIEYRDHVIRIEARLELGAQEIAQEFQDKNISTYIHLAGKSSVKDCEDDPTTCMQMNSEYSLKFYSAAVQAGVKRFIFVSSAHVYDSNIPSPYDISSPLKPFNQYGRSKLDAEQKLQAAESSTTQLSIARIFSVHSLSMRDHFLAAGLVRRAINRDFSAIPGLEKIRDFLSTELAMKELIYLAESETFPPIVNICSGIGVKIKDLGLQIFKSFGLEKEFHLIKNIDSPSPDVIVGVKREFK